MCSALAVLALCLPMPGDASRDASGLCADAAHRAAKATGVPYDVLVAISLIETGRNARPWPWTVNLGGDGRWLDSLEAAEAVVSEALDQGRTNIDLGCFQLNYRWHASAFGSVAEMLDPDANALYAAEYLAQHHAESGDWATAAAAYHSATPEHAERYRARFEAAWSGAAADAPLAVATAPIDRLNRFPLLLAGQKGSRGSLVPATGGGQRLIGSP
ncbi:MAG: lytic transglycosylase domain-containing protein [Rhodobacteraceae bacterium]|nr:lytic transglycosylase domain-containing protein [Paracoccaceae bacterium]